MVKAVSTIIVGDKTYAPGKIVNGLSEKDISWLQKDGMINVIPDAPKEKPKQEPAKSSGKRK